MLTLWIRSDVRIPREGWKKRADPSLPAHSPTPTSGGGGVGVMSEGRVKVNETGLFPLA